MDAQLAGSSRKFYKISTESDDPPGFSLTASGSRAEQGPYAFHEISSGIKDRTAESC
jgi:hypothetical protein